MTDRKPLRLEGRYLWHNGDHPLSSGLDYGDHLPAAVFARLTGFISKPNRVTALVKAYPTREAAEAALAAATSSTAVRSAGDRS